MKKSFSFKEFYKTKMNGIGDSVFEYKSKIKDESIGEELHKIQTGNVITCLGIMNKSLALIGNHKGYMEVYHLRSGDLYSSIRAHVDPIDSLEVDGNYACTATFEDPPCLKVWDILFEQTRCIYRLEYSPGIEFCCMAMWNMKCVLGSSTEQKLCVIEFKDDYVDSINLDRPGGEIERVKVWNEWICSSHKNEVLLNALRFHKYEHFGTFLSQVKQIRAIAAIELNSSLKIVLGGSALELLNFNFNLPDEETHILDIRFPLKVEKTSLAENKEKNNRSMKQELLDEFYDENLINSDDEKDSESDTLLNCGHKVTLQSNNENKYFKQEDIAGPVSLLNKIEADLPNCNENRASTPQSNFERCHHVNYDYENNGDKIFICIIVEREACLSPSARKCLMQDRSERGVAMRKLKEELDKYKQQEEIANFAKSKHNVEKENSFTSNINYSKFELDAKYLNSKKETKECEKDKKNKTSVLIIVKSEKVIIKFKSSEKITLGWEEVTKRDAVIMNNTTNMNTNCSIAIIKDSVFEIVVKHKSSEKKTKECKKDKKKESILTIVKGKELIIEHKSSEKITKECKKDKKKESQKSKHRKCQIM